jgi:hypothetical protein
MYQAIQDLILILIIKYLSKIIFKEVKKLPLTEGARSDLPYLPYLPYLPGLPCLPTLISTV